MLTFNFLRPLKKLENVSSIDSILEFLPEDQDYKITVIEKLIETRNRTTTEVVAQKMTPEMIPPLASGIFEQCNDVLHTAHQTGDSKQSDHQENNLLPFVQTRMYGMKK